MLYNDLLDHKLIINNALLYKINEFDRIAVYNIYKNKKFNIKKIFYWIIKKLIKYFEKKNKNNLNIQYNINLNC